MGEMEGKVGREEMEAMEGMVAQGELEAMEEVEVNLDQGEAVSLEHLIHV